MAENARYRIDVVRASFEGRASPYGKAEEGADYFARFRLREGWEFGVIDKRRRSWRIERLLQIPRSRARPIQSDGQYGLPRADRNPHPGWPPFSRRHRRKDYQRDAPGDTPWKSRRPPRHWLADRLSSVGPRELYHGTGFER